MTEPSTPLKAGKRGRKPLGERAMSAAERKRLSRNRQAGQGSVEFNLRLSGGTLNFVDQLALTHGMGRSETMELLLDMAIARVATVVAEAELLMEQGGSQEDVAIMMSSALGTTPRQEIIGKYKEVMGIN